MKIIYRSMVIAPKVGGLEETAKAVSQTKFKYFEFNGQLFEVKSGVENGCIKHGDYYGVRHVKNDVEDIYRDGIAGSDVEYTIGQLKTCVLLGLSHAELGGDKYYIVSENIAVKLSNT